jgi:hypothetical protein
LVSGEDIAKAHVAVVVISNQTNSSSYDAACKAATDTLTLTLNQLGRYLVQSKDTVDSKEEALRALAAEQNLDFIMYGKMSKGTSGGIDCSLSVFDRAKGKTTLSQSRKAAGVLDIFDVTDDLVVAVLESMTGSHIGYGTIAIKDSGEKGSYTVLVDGYSAGNDLENLDRVLIGRRSVEIVQKRLLGSRTIAKTVVEVKEGETAELEFAVPYLMDDEKDKLEGLRRDIEAGWNDAAIVGTVDTKIAELLSILSDVSYSPRLSKYKDEATQLGGKWVLRKSRLAIEGSAWDPKLELLEGVGTLFAEAKAYPDPDKIRSDFQDNARLVATLFELEAGKALGDGDLGKGMECFENALMVSTRYLDGSRLADYAYAVSTLKDVQEKTETVASNHGTEMSVDLKKAFAPWISAGTRFYSLRDQVESGTACVLVASDFSKQISVDGSDYSDAPFALQANQGSRVIAIQSKGAEKSFTLTIAAGVKLVFIQDGFASFGKISVGYGTLSLTSDPPGMQIVIDKGETFTTPVHVELPPGPHSYEIQQTMLDNVYYTAKPIQWITITAGEETRVPLAIAAARGYIEIKNAPPGYQVFVNDEKMGETPLGQIEVKAGFQKIRFEHEGEKPRILWIRMAPDETSTVSWGAMKDFAIQLEHRTIELDGTPDSWGDINPLYEAYMNNYFMGSADYGVQSFYICSDDKYLYWRMDFYKTNPFFKMPKDAKKGIALQLFVQSFDQRKNLNLDISLHRDINQTYCDIGTWDNPTRKYESVWRNSMTIKQSEAMLVARIELAGILRFCQGPLQLHYQLSALDDNFKWMRTVRSALGWVDFSKITTDHPETDRSVVLGVSPETAIRLERKTISVNGKPDSWVGVDPIFSEMDAPTVFLGQEGYGLVRVYMCRDETNLYLRLDFEKTNPFWKLPKAVKIALENELSIRISESQQLNLGIGYDCSHNRINTWGGIWDARARLWTNFDWPPGVISFKRSETMLVESITLSAIGKYCTGIQRIQVEIANKENNGNREEAGSLTTPWQYVDFMNIP